MAEILPTASPSKSTASYMAVCEKPSTMALDALDASVRGFSKDANAAIQQVGEWQGALRDAEFDESNEHLRPRMENCDQRQRAMLATLTEVTSLLQRLRKNVADLRADQTELVRCGTPQK